MTGIEIMNASKEELIDRIHVLDSNEYHLNMKDVLSQRDYDILSNIARERGEIRKRLQEMERAAYQG